MFSSNPQAPDQLSSTETDRKEYNEKLTHNHRTTLSLTQILFKKDSLLFSLTCPSSLLIQRANRIARSPFFVFYNLLPFVSGSDPVDGWLGRHFRFRGGSW
uniref:Uncharacterized protein n=1 Tax=Salix viminalis TaxID=40686 RepID=A0A6N2LPE8_SALVM